MYICIQKAIYSNSITVICGCASNITRHIPTATELLKKINGYDTAKKN